MIKNKITTIIFAIVLISVSLCCWLKPKTDFSLSERRPLASFPEVSAESVFSGDFSSEFDKYTTDQFPLRDAFRTIKAIFSTKVLGKADNNGLYSADGHLSKMEYPYNPDMTKYAINKFNTIYNSYIKDTNSKTYLSVVPDKNYFLADKNGYLSLDYTAFIDEFKSGCDYMEYIDILPYLSIDDFYTTDSHWKQDKIKDVAQHIGSEMGVTVSDEYTTNRLNIPFYGVYAGQSALPVKPDEIRFLTNEITDNFTVTYYGSGKPEKGELYNLEKAQSKDPYEMFLSGTMPLITIENPLADNDKHLIVFRDSYGSSLAPLLATGYSKTTIVDIRYIQSSFIGNFVDFENSDILFIYSTTLLNNSTALQ